MNHRSAIFILIAVTILIMLLNSPGRGRPPRRISSDALDRVLNYWTPRDPYRVRDLLNGGLLILGFSGSGKTTSSGYETAQAIVRNCPDSGGLILAAKNSDAEMWWKIFASAGRKKDLIVFSPSQPWRFNFLDYEMRFGRHTRNITRCIMLLGESLRSRGDRTNRDQEVFWEKQNERLIYNAVEILKVATGRVSAPDLQRFIIGAAMSPEELSSAAWRGGFHCQCLEKADRARKTLVEKHDCELAIDFWLGEFPSMSEKTRSSILAGVLGILHVFNTGVVRDLISNDTNIDPEVMLQGKWILVDMPPTDWGEIGSFIASGWKLQTQRCVLRRTIRPNDPIHVIWADEASQFINSFDSFYAAQSRSRRGCSVFLSQSIPGFYSAFGGESGKHDVLSLLANFSHAIVHAADPETASWAAQKLGRRLETFFSGSTTPPADLFDQLIGTPRFTGSFSEHYENVLQENVFMNGLRTGGPANRYACDAIVIKAGTPFSSGENWLFRTFHQG